MKPLDSLKLQQEIGVDEVFENAPTNKFTKGQPQNIAIKQEVEPKKIVQSAPAPIIKEEEVSMPKASAAAPVSIATAPSAAIKEAQSLADKAKTLAELEAAVRSFEGCALKKTANKTVFCDGNPKAEVMLIGEAPGANEDMEGIPFCGQSGKLMDEVFAAAGFNRKDNLYITNTVFWRPPGNRKPTPEELDICRPFVEKHIGLISPKVVILVGGTAVESILKSKGAVSSMRGKFYPYSNNYLSDPIKIMVTFHPSYLLRQPSQKKQAWQDVLFLKNNMN